MILVRQDYSITENHIGIVTSDTIIQLNLLNHAYVSIFYEPSKEKSSHVSVGKHFENYEQKRNDYVIQLCVQDDFPNMADNNFENLFDENENFSYSNGIIYVSPSAYFNIMKRNVQRYVNYRMKEIKVDMTVLSELDSSHTYDYATDVDLSLVSCPFGSIELENIDDILKSYFAEPKLICPNEVFSVALDQLTLHTPLYLWFSVKSCYRSDEITNASHTNSLFVSSEHTRLILSNPVNAYVPYCSCVYQNNNKLSSFFWNEHFRKLFLKQRTQIRNLVNIVDHKLMKSKDTTVLLYGIQGVGKSLLIQSICEEYCLHFYEVNCYDLVGESLTATEKRIKKLFETFVSVGPCVLYLKHIELLCKDKEGAHEERKIMHSFCKQLEDLPNDFPLLVVGSCISVNDMTPRFQSEFLYHIELLSPDESDRISLIKAISTDFVIGEKIIIDLGKKSSGFVLSDFIALFTKIHYLLVDNSVPKCPNFTKNMYAINEDIANTAFDDIRSMKANGSNDVRIPKVKWEDVGGLQHAKKDILDTIELPLKIPKLFSTTLQRSGLLFYGPPGCGKTLLAKAIATEFTLNFYSVKGPELINMYVGQSEENVRNVFIKARSMVPCIIFFDELDSIAPNRGLSGDSGGVMDRIVSQLLAELDGIHNNANIFVVGATNRPDLLDPALLRPGRFDKVIYVGVPEDRDERVRILKAVTRKLKFTEDVNLEMLIDMCPPNLTGADFSALASECLMNCYRRLIRNHEDHGTELNSDNVIISVDDIRLAFENMVPSVSMSELERYKMIREQYLSQ